MLLHYILIHEIDPVFQELAQPPCMNCGQYQACVFKLDNEKRIKGEDPLPPCALFLQREGEAARVCSNGDGAAWWPKGVPGWGTSLEHKQEEFENMAREYEAFWGIDLSEFYSHAD